MTLYYRPLVQTGPVRPPEAVTLAGGWGWFTQAERLGRDAPARIVPVSDVPMPVLTRLTKPRGVVAGLDLGQPQIMGILNVTPDSFSDGGLYRDASAAAQSATAMMDAGAGIIDIGGESTRPGADFIPVDQEIDRTVPVIRAATGVPVSIDTRKAKVARAALDAGARLVNDVSGFTFDSDLAPLCAAHNVPVCVMHAQGDPATMQDAPQYEDVLLDVYDFLAAQVERLTAVGIARDQILIDPGIGFGKTIDHNLAILQGISLFHGIGCAILLGVSRKGFIGKIGRVPVAQDRAPGSIAVALCALDQGVQILRVHDVGETAQAVRLWRAVTT